MWCQKIWHYEAKVRKVHISISVNSITVKLSISVKLSINSVLLVKQYFIGPHSIGVYTKNNTISNNTNGRGRPLLFLSYLSQALFHIYPCMTGFMLLSWVPEWGILEHIKRIKPQPLISQMTFIRVLLLSVFFNVSLCSLKWMWMCPSIILPEYQNKSEGLWARQKWQTSIWSYHISIWPSIRAQTEWWAV